MSNKKEKYNPDEDEQMIIIRKKFQEIMAILREIREMNRRAYGGYKQKKT